MPLRCTRKPKGPKRLYWLQGASHVDLYNKDQYVGPAVAELTEFFTIQLGQLELDEPTLLARV